MRAFPDVLLTPFPTALGIFLISLLVYLNSLRAGFAFDDNFAIITNGDVTADDRPLRELLVHDFWGQDIRSDQSHKSYRPATVLAFRLTRLAWNFFEKRNGSKSGGGGKQSWMGPEYVDTRGLDPFPFHLVNVVLHGVVSVLVYRLALTLALLRDWNGFNKGKKKEHNTPEEKGNHEAKHAVVPKTKGTEKGNLRHRKRGKAAKQHSPVNESGQSPTISASEKGLKMGHRLKGHVEAMLAGCLFALHPIHTEAVAGLVGLAEILSAIFSILAFLSYVAVRFRFKSVDGSQQEVAGGSVVTSAAYFVFAIAFVWIGALAKEIGITMIGTMLAFELLFDPPPKPEEKSDGKWTKWGPQLSRLLLLGAAGLVYVKMRSWIASDHIVRIYRKVENPIPFEDSVATRLFTTAYVHAKYASLLVLPLHLSADWSFACIPYVENLSDVRNIATLLLYGFLIWVVCNAHPLKLAKSMARKLLTGSAVLTTEYEHDKKSRWLLVVVYGLVVFPFFPASNVLFYVGTFVGERLLYFPSIGFCILLAHCIVSMSDWGARKTAKPSPENKGAEHGPNVEMEGSKQGHMGKVWWYVSASVTMVLLCSYSWRTVTRNKDWESEEHLFRAAQKVCLNSAKVRLNSGILERRYQNWTGAMEHFTMAQQIEPGFCDPSYWIGVTLVSLGRTQEGVKELEKGLECKYVAAHSLEALNKIFAALLKDHQDNPLVLMNWGRILMKPSVNRLGDGCISLEQGAVVGAQHLRNEKLVRNATEICLEALRNHTQHKNSKSPNLQSKHALVQSPAAIFGGMEPEVMVSCIEGRLPVLLEVAKHGINSKIARRELYQYIQKKGDLCRKRQPTSEMNIHQLLVNRFQSADPEDPWLQYEWGNILTEFNRVPEALEHYQVSGIILLAHLTSKVSGSPQTFSTPLSFTQDQPITPIEAETGAVRGFEVASRINPGEACKYMQNICDARLKGEWLRNAAGQWDEARNVQKCLAELKRVPECAAYVNRFG